MAATSELLPDGFRLATAEECYQLHAAAWDIPLSYMRTHIRPLGWDSRFRFECIQCGHCCMARHRQGEEISNAEAERIGNYAIRRELLTPIPHQVGYKLPLRNLDAIYYPYYYPYETCGWLEMSPTGQAICLVHEVKPAICRLAPVGGIIDHKGLVVALALLTHRDEICPGMHIPSPHVLGEWAAEHGLRTWVEEQHADKKRLAER